MEPLAQAAPERFGLTARQQREVIDVLQTAADRIECVAVFGSRAQERYRPNSDLDLVLYGPVTEADCDRLWTLFQDSALPFSVDVKSYDCIAYAPLRAHIDRAACPWLVRAGGDLQSIGRAEP